ncbi:hypothetical protein LzC2_17520 [Planctomycetes bacterium LzC2]|uniref:Uncharacterized protein n=1 Tax=Alienimonas chondri TaxID=2681879 RepID=A0ABX1VCA0_9PLAN|nr:hypothetical protein [Alienimonas chondri]
MLPVRPRPDGWPGERIAGGPKSRGHDDRAVDRQAGGSEFVVEREARPARRVLPVVGGAKPRGGAVAVHLGTAQEPFVDRAPRFRAVESEPSVGHLVESGVQFAQQQEGGSPQCPVPDRRKRRQRVGQSPVDGQQFRVADQSARGAERGQQACVFAVPGLGILHPPQLKTDQRAYQHRQERDLFRQAGELADERGPDRPAERRRQEPRVQQRGAVASVFGSAGHQATLRRIEAPAQRPRNGRRGFPLERETNPRACAMSAGVSPRFGASRHEGATLPARNPLAQSSGRRAGVADAAHARAAPGKARPPAESKGMENTNRQLLSVELDARRRACPARRGLRGLILHASSLPSYGRRTCAE